MTYEVLYITTLAFVLYLIFSQMELRTFRQKIVAYKELTEQQKNALNETAEDLRRMIKTMEEDEEKAWPSRAKIRRPKEDADWPDVVE